VVVRRANCLKRQHLFRHERVTRSQAVSDLSSPQSSLDGTNFTRFLAAGPGRQTRLARPHPPVRSAHCNGASVLRKRTMKQVAEGAC
jgi:hypothetical protein